MRKFLVHLGLALGPVLLLVGGILALPYDARFGIERAEASCRNARYLYQKIRQETPLQVAIMGTSRSMCAIDDRQLARIWAPEKIGHLGVCRNGRDLHLALAEQLFQIHRPQMLIVEVPDQEPTNSHPALPSFQTLSGLISPKVVSWDGYLPSIWQSLTWRFHYQRQHWLGQELIPESAYSSAEDKLVFVPALGFSMDRSPEPTVPTNASLGAFPRRCLAQLAALCNRSDCELVFVYLRDYDTPADWDPPAFEFYREHGRLLVPPHELVDGKGFWMDADHLNEAGASRLTHWLMVQLDHFSKG